VNATESILLAQLGDPTKAWILEQFPALGAQTPAELAHAIARFLSRRDGIGGGYATYLDRESLASIASAFHKKAGTLTEKVRSNIAALADGAPIVRFSHQPIMLAYMGVLGQFVLMHFVADELYESHGVLVCELHQSVDYDVATEKRLRVGYYPNVEGRGGFLPLSVPRLAGSSYAKLNWAMHKPSEAVIRNWYRSLDAVLTRDMSILGRRGVRETRPGQTFGWYRAYKHEVGEAISRSTSLAEFNCILSSRIVNLHWKLPTAFVPSTEMVVLMREQFEQLLALYPRLVRETNRAVDHLRSMGVDLPLRLRASPSVLPFWYSCTNCSSRVAMDIQGRISSGECAYCHAIHRIDLGSPGAPNLEVTARRLSPRVLFQDLLDVFGLSMVGGVGYLGNAEHYLVSGSVLSNLGLDVPPDLIWRPKGIYFGPAESRAAIVLSQQIAADQHRRIHDALRLVYSSRAVGLYYILSDGSTGLLESWNRHFERGRGITDPILGEIGFELSQNEIDSLIRAVELYE